MKTNVVVISGKQGAGKSTITKELVSRFNSLSVSKTRAYEVRFAKVIYDIHDFAIQTLREHGIDVPEKDGELLQLLGTEWGRKKYGDNIWVEATRGLMAKHESSFYKPSIENQTLMLVLSDCRFMNEFDAFPEALRVRLTCNEATRKLRTHSWRENTFHPSEIDLDYYSNMKKFDLYLETDKMSIDACATLIFAQLDKNSWKEKRK